MDYKAMLRPPISAADSTLYGQILVTAHRVVWSQ